MSSPQSLNIELQIRQLSRAHAAIHRQDVMKRKDFVELAYLLIRAMPLNYDSYCNVRDQLPPKFSRILTASLFARLPRGPDDVVSPYALLRYLREIMILRYSYRCLAMYDQVGDGYLREGDLNNYIFEAIPGAPELAALQDNFYPFYVYTVVRHFMFFLDHKRQGKIQLRELAGSRAFSEWLRMLPSGHPFLGPAGESLILSPDDISRNDENLDRSTLLFPKNSSKGDIIQASLTSPSSTQTLSSLPSSSSSSSLPSTHTHPSSSTSSPSLSSVTPSILPRSSSPSSGLTVQRVTPEDLLAAMESPTVQTPSPSSINWFSASNALRVYSAYLSLDKDENGMLSQVELAGYHGRGYTGAFVQRLFQECKTYESEVEGGGAEIDYKAYLDVVLATEHKHTHESLRFFFKLLDVEGKGWFGLKEVNFFYAQVQSKLASMGFDTVATSNVADEIFDMVSPSSPGKITLEDLRKSKMGAAACGILLDAQAFIAHDRREELREEEEETLEDGGEILAF